MRPRPGTETWRLMFGSSKSGWRGFRRKERRVSPSFAPFPRALGEVVQPVCVDTWGRARGPGWGTPRHPFLYTRPRLSLLLPAVTGVPSPRATDPPSHVRPLIFPCLLPPLQTPSSGPNLGLTLPLWGFRRQLHLTPHPPNLPRLVLSPSPIRDPPSIPSPISAPPCCL